MKAMRATTIAPTFLAVALFALLLSSSAVAATIVNGDFESGNLNGWHVSRQIEVGNWFAYSGTNAPLNGKHRQSDPVQAPPQGRFAAIADEATSDSLILYQDVSLPSGGDQTLSLLAYYDSRRPYPEAPVAQIEIPTPDTLSAESEDLGGQDNQQFRIDVIKPGAPLDSLDPADILRTVFQTRAGDPPTKPPTRFTADLGAFAGQTVRLRIAVAATKAVLNAGVDDVSISGSTRSGPGAGKTEGGRFRIAKVHPNGRNGTATLFVQVPEPGLVTASSSVGQGRNLRRQLDKRARGMIRATTVKARTAGVVRLRLSPTRLGRTALARAHRLRAAIAVVYAPASGARQVVHTHVVLKLLRRQPH